MIFIKRISVLSVYFTNIKVYESNKSVGNYLYKIMCFVKDYKTILKNQSEILAPDLRFL